MREPIAINLSQQRSRPVNAARLVNLYAEQAPEGSKCPVVLYGTPGQKTFATVGDDTIRAGIEGQGYAYILSGAFVYRVDSTGAATLCTGDIIPPTGAAYMINNGVQIGLLTVPDTYAIVGTTVTKVTAAAYQAASSLDYVDGYAIWSVNDTSGEWFISALRDLTSIDALDFASAESNPDGLIRVMADHGEIWLFGTASVEPWANTGASPFPFERVPGARMERGCIAAGSVVKMDNSLFWLGDDRIVYRADGYRPVRVSNTSVEETLRAGTVSDAIGQVYSQGGHWFYLLTLPSLGRTLCFDAQTTWWHERQSGTSLTPAPWDANCVFSAFGKTLVGTENGMVYELDLDTYTDAGAYIRRAVASAPIYPNGNRAILKRVELEVETGVGLNATTESAPLSSVFLDTTLPAYLAGLEVTTGSYDAGWRVAPSGRISPYFMFAAMTLAPGQFTAAQIKDACAMAIDRMTVGRRQDTATYANPTLVSFASGKVFFCNLGGTTAGAAPSDAAITVAAQTLVDGTVTWEYTGLALPAAWDWYLIEIENDLFNKLVPDSNDAYAAVLLSAARAGAVDAAWLNTASAHPGLSRIDVLALLASNCISDDIANNLSATFQSSTDPDGASYTVQWLADNCEAWRGMTALASLQTTVGDAGAAAAATAVAATLRTGIMALWDTSAGRFRAYYGETGVATQAGETDFVNRMRFHIWPLLQGVVTTAYDVATYGRAVSDYIEEAVPTLYTGSYDTFVLAEYFLAVADMLDTEQARATMLARSIARIDTSGVTVADAAIMLEAAALTYTVGAQGSRPVVMMRWSDDAGATWSNERQASIGAKGQRRVRAMWERNGAFRQRMHEFAISDPVKVALHGINLDIEELSV